MRGGARLRVALQPTEDLVGLAVRRADRKTHEFFRERDYPDVQVLDKLFQALKATPVKDEA